MNAPGILPVTGPILVSAAVIFDGERVLIAKRRSDSPLEAGKWEFPGGKVEPGEDPETALRREISEELGCEIAVAKLFLLTSHVYIQPERRLHIVLLSYECRVTGGQPRALQVAELAWINRSDLHDYEFAAADLPIILRLRNSL